MTIDRTKPVLSRPVVVDGWDFTELLTPAAVAGIFAVDAKTVARWRETGKLACIYTPGGHARYSVQQVEHLIHNREAPRDAHV